ncbi:MAG: MarR family transcriptional regulator [Candidatus Saccharimonadales bacterium]|jgi:DNA-binding MarR family transcriptional regulator
MSRLDQTYIYKLDRLKLLIQKEIDAILGDQFSELTMSQFFLLFAVKDLVNPNQNEIAKYLNISPPAISRQVAVAEESNLIKASRIGDLNQSKISLTDEGVSVFNESYKIINKHLEYIFKYSEDLAGLSDHLDRLVINFKEGDLKH